MELGYYKRNSLGCYPDDGEVMFQYLWIHRNKYKLLQLIVSNVFEEENAKTTGI